MDSYPAHRRQPGIPMGGNVPIEILAGLESAKIRESGEAAKTQSILSVQAHALSEWFANRRNERSVKIQHSVRMESPTGVYTIHSEFMIVTGED